MAFHMGRWLSAALRRLGHETGFMLPELLVAAAMLVFVIGAAMTALVGSMRSESTGRQFAQEIQDAQAGLARIMREVSQANRIVVATASTVRFVLPGATDYVVQYQCDVPQPGTSFRQCTRVRAVLPPNSDPNSITMPAASSGAPIVQRVTNGTTVFAYQAPNQAGTDSAGQPVDANGAPIPPTYVDGKIAVPAAGTSAGTPLSQMSHTTVLSSGTYLRNADVGS
jgi:type II secretory pathway pseudopilin PulG